MGEVTPTVRLFYNSQVIWRNECKEWIAHTVLADPKKESKIIFNSPTESATGPTELK